MKELSSVRQPGRARSVKPESVWRRELWEWLRALGIAFTIVILLWAFVFRLSTVKGESMQPTLYEHEWLFVNKIAYELGKPKAGDVVILKDPSDGPDKKKYLVKRIIGVPGDTIEGRGGQLYVNGELRVEPYTDSEIEDGDFGPVQVGEGKYFIMGDNRHLGASKDSRTFGEVDESILLGRTEFIMWPIVRWKVL
ncbi:signal peptidase I [Cohnella sp. 56]|uniref:signal peptidase I n=1 Tax=Cohnella sp. 56 TaxID=3113722 RepID=UPI0030E87508